MKDSTAEYIDAHCHLSDPRWLDCELKSALTKLQSNNIKGFIDCSASPEDWTRQTELSQWNPRIYLCRGLHPYWIHEQTQKEQAQQTLEIERALDQLARLLPNSVGLGELGLDGRKNYRFSKALQQDLFEQQLELAELSSKPIVLHVVRWHHEAQQTLKVLGVPRRGGMVHRFSGSSALAEEYLKLGLYLSLNNSICNKDREEDANLVQMVRSIPDDRLLLETDGPDQELRSWTEGPKSLFQVAESCARMRRQQKTAAELLFLSRNNLVRLFDLKDPQA